MRNFKQFLLNFGLFALLFSQSALSADGISALESIKYVSLPEGKLGVKLHFSKPLDLPKSFSTTQPKRILFDFNHATINLKDKNDIVDVGALHKITSLEANNRTRVIFELRNSAKYTVTQKGNDFLIILEGEKNPVKTSSMDTPTSVNDKSSNTKHEVRKIDFQGISGQGGKLVVGLSDEGGGVDVQSFGNKLLVTFPKTSLPQQLEHAYEVSQIGSPVDKIDAMRNGQDTQLALAMHGKYEHLAYQVDKQFIIDVHPQLNNQEENHDRPVYKGRRITLNFQDIKVRAVLQLLADFTGVNIVVSDSVKGNITLRLKNVPWDQALEIILKTRSLSKRQVGSVLMIAPTRDVTIQEKLDLEAKHEADDLVPLISELIQVNYAQADNLATLLKTKGNSLLSQRGNVSVDPRTNTLWVQDTANRVAEVRRLVRRLDVPVKQVLIEARIVSVTKDFEHELGIRWGVTDPNHFTGTLAGANQMLVGGTPLAVNPFTQRLNVNLPSINPSSSSVGLALAKLGKDFLLDLELSAMESEDRGDVIANPRLITANQSTAKIESGQEIPYQESTSSGATAIAFKKVVLSLEVTPQITPDHKVVLHLTIHKDDPQNISIANSPTSNGSNTSTTSNATIIPAILTKQIQTNVLVDNGETVVLGGIYQQTADHFVQRVPFFGSIPIIGALFRHTSISDQRQELLIFITPKIILEGKEGKP